MNIENIKSKISADLTLDEWQGRDTGLRYYLNSADGSRSQIIHGKVYLTDGKCVVQFDESADVSNPQFPMSVERFFALVESEGGRIEFQEANGLTYLRGQRDQELEIEQRREQRKTDFIARVKNARESKSKTTDTDSPSAIA